MTTNKRSWHCRLWATLAWFCAVTATVTAAEPLLTVHKIDGSHLSGRLRDWTPDELVMSLDNESDSARIPSQELLRVDWANADLSVSGSVPTIELIDGTRLPIDHYEVSQRLATVETSLTSEPLSIATSEIRWVQFSNSAEAGLLERDLREKPLVGDLLIVRRRKSNTLDYLSGVVGDVNDRRVEFVWDGEPIPVNRSKVEAIAYYHANRSTQPAALCWLTTREGARLPLASFKIEAPHLLAETIGGIEIKIPLASSRSADFSNGKVAYLSDLEPLQQKWSPYLDLPPSASLIASYGAPRKDQSFDGSALTLDWPASLGGLTTYKKGLALRSRTELVYRIPSEMKRFVCFAGIDPVTAGEGTVLLKISADDRVLWQGEIEGGAEPVEIHLLMNGARQIHLLVDYGANLDFGDRLHLAEARLSK